MKSFISKELDTMQEIIYNIIYRNRRGTTYDVSITVKPKEVRIKEYKCH